MPFVKVVQLPGLPPKGDIVEWIQAGGTKEEFLRIVAETPEWTPTEGAASDRPEIVIDVDEGRASDESEAALADGGDVYQRAGSLVEVVTDRWTPDGIRSSEEAPRVALVRLHRLRELLASRACFVQETEDGRKRIHPPDWLPKCLHARPFWRSMPRLTGLVESPTLLADGGILQTPGYDPRTGLFYFPSCDFPPVPKSPTLDDARKSCEILLGVVCDFPFSSASHRSAWVACVLTAFARMAIRGPIPMFLFEANAQGTGKTMLANLVSITATGRMAPLMSQPGDDDESRKRITAIAAAGFPLVCIDNIVGVLGSPSLEAALTGESWTDRILGSTEKVTAPHFEKTYQTCLRVSNAEFKTIQLTRSAICPQWNYTVHPRAGPENTE